MQWFSLVRSMTETEYNQGTRIRDKVGEKNEKGRKGERKEKTYLEIQLQFMDLLEYLFFLCSYAVP